MFAVSSSVEHSPAPSSWPIRQFQPEGNVPGRDELLRMHQWMVTLRLWDERCLKLQRSGRISFCVTTRGEEATQLGTVAALRSTDWVFPAYRQPGIPLWRGATLEQLAHQLFGTEQDISQGRQMPCHYSFHELYYASVSSVIGTQIVHAAGGAMAAQIKGTDDIAVTYFGDGATSSNDFHSALTFAGARKAPALFFCVNNQYAISLHASEQCGAECFAAKGPGYGVHSERVDGNDVLAVYQATQEAASRARAGKGPSLLELVTYRMNPHSSSDDDGRYRREGEQEAWQERDPILRFERFLREQGVLDEAEQANVYHQAEEAIQQATKAAEQAAMPAWNTLAQDVYAQPSARLQQELDILEETEKDLNIPHAGAFPL
jgi:pyruvate dehydrogenase E1 component alpha subunit